MTIPSILVSGSSGCLGHPLARALAAEGRTVVGPDVARVVRAAKITAQ